MDKPFLASSTTYEPEEDKAFNLEAEAGVMVRFLYRGDDAGVIATILAARSRT